MRLFFTVCFLLAAVYSYSQVKLEDVVKPGTKLIYAVEQNGNKYDFIVTVSDPKGTSFEWEMTAPMEGKGSISHTAKALQGAYRMYNYFQSEMRQLDDQTLSVWISQKMFKDLTKGTEPVKVCMHDPHEEPAPMKYFMDGDLVVKVDGDGTKINDKFVRPAKKAKDKWIIDPTSDDYFTFYNSAAFPVILRMHSDFTLRLKEVRSKK